MHVLFATSSCNSGFIRIPSSKLACNVAQFVGLKSVPFGRLKKEERHIVSLETGKWPDLRADQVVDTLGSKLVCYYNLEDVRGGRIVYEKVAGVSAP